MTMTMGADEPWSAVVLPVADTLESLLILSA